MAKDHSDDPVRVGNPERERAIAFLNDAFASGYLDIAEFEERSGSVYAAKTRGDLRAVLENLPVAGQLFLDALAPGASPTPVVPATPVLHRPVEWEANWETVRRKGVWEVPPNVLVTGSMGTVDLDYTNAVFGSPVVTLQLQVSVTTVKLRLGSDHELRDSGLVKTGWSSVKDKGGPPSRPGGPVINLTGSISGMTGLTIKRS